MAYDEHRRRAGLGRRPLERSDDPEAYGESDEEIRSFHSYLVDPAPAAMRATAIRTLPPVSSA